MATNTKSIKESNDLLRDFVLSEGPGHISRLSDAATKVALAYNAGAPYGPHAETMQTHDGIYISAPSDIDLYAKVYNAGIMNSKYIACFPKLCVNEQNLYLAFRKETWGIHNRALEPFYLMSESGFSEAPWTHALAGKKVLIIHPFVESFKAQLAAGFTFFDDGKHIFQPGQAFEFYKTFNCLSGVRPHKNWFETFTIMAREIEKLEFDVALLGCGGYGVPLCNFISTKLKKKAIYIGGGLQLLFGVVGKRWLNHEIIGPLLKNGKWIHPSESEHIKGFAAIEGGCYW